MQMTLRTDRPLLRAAARSTRYLMISLVAPTAPPRAGRPPINVGIVLDRSGSMDGARKFALAREAVEQSLRLLGPTDRFTLVVYDTEVDVLMPSSLATADAKRVALARLTEVGPRGGTDLHAGWTAGAKQLLEYLANECVNRVLLLTDGLANEGVTEPTALVAMAGELRRKGIATSTFGVGADFDEVLLRDIAHESGGNSYFIETPAQIVDLLTSELGEALEVVRRRVVLQVTLPTGASCELLNRYRHELDAGQSTVRVDLGDLSSGQELSLAMRLTFPEDRDGITTSARVTQTSADAPSLTSELSWRYASHDENDAQPRQLVVDREVATLYASRARAEATEANRSGDYAHAKWVLESTARRIRSYANGDPALEALWRALQAEVATYAEREMTPIERKSSFFLAEAQGKGRDRQGKARR